MTNGLLPRERWPELAGGENVEASKTLGEL